ncbi:MipA/OmpV family protein [Pseudoduganella sp. LjRoot289]|uniref:MipA/OmpV family protein n=1 Tax=Pseudoduganella sp. LjRoot289 TaxID=3342314 RepID=UPI003ED054A8
MERSPVTAALLAMSLAMATPQAWAWAQSEESLIPEGSTDVWIGATLGSAPSRPGSALRSTYLVPQFSVEWSNGVFLQGLELGMKMSRDPLLQYGPVASLNLGGRRSDGSSAGARPVFGGFVNYQPVQELLLHAHAYAPAGRDGKGALLNLRAATHTWVVPHHMLGVAAGVNLADGAGMQSDFGTARYRPAGGIRDVFAEGRWHWQFSRKYTLTAALHGSCLLGDAGASPRTSQRTGIASSLTVQYSY